MERYNGIDGGYLKFAVIKKLVPLKSNLKKGIAENDMVRSKVFNYYFTKLLHISSFFLSYKLKLAL